MCVWYPACQTHATIQAFQQNNSSEQCELYGIWTAYSGSTQMKKEKKNPKITTHDKQIYKNNADFVEDKSQNAKNIFFRFISDMNFLRI